MPARREPRGVLDDDLDAARELEGLEDVDDLHPWPSPRAGIDVQVAGRLMRPLRQVSDSTWKVRSLRASKSARDFSSPRIGVDDELALPERKRVDADPHAVHGRPANGPEPSSRESAEKQHDVVARGDREMDLKGPRGIVGGELELDGPRLVPAGTRPSACRPPVTTTSRKRPCVPAGTAASAPCGPRAVLARQELLVLEDDALGVAPAASRGPRSARARGRRASRRSTWRGCRRRSSCPRP